MKKVEMVGKKFGKLTVLKQAPNLYKKNGVLCWECSCECGQRKTISGYSLRIGVSRSCGCIAKIHGKVKTKSYRAWHAMRDRCLNKNHKAFNSYGGRGISICAQWNDFRIFHKDMGDPPGKKYSLDRIDNNGNYGPDNCRWATQKMQANNRRGCYVIPYNGFTMTLNEASIMSGMGRATLAKRIKRFNGDMSKVFKMPLRYKNYSKIMISSFVTKNDLCIAESVKDAEYLSGVKENNIYRVAGGQRKQSGGFSFMYMDKKRSH